MTTTRLLVYEDISGSGGRVGEVTTEPVDSRTPLSTPASSIPGRSTATHCAQPEPPTSRQAILPHRK